MWLPLGIIFLVLGIGFLFKYCRKRKEAKEAKEQKDFVVVAAGSLLLCWLAPGWVFLVLGVLVLGSIFCGFL